MTTQQDLIIYRYLKHENLLVLNNGYEKLIHFGFAKQSSCRYVTPQIILNKGHDHAVNVQATGILKYKLTTGVHPFAAADPMKIYNIILKGIDTLE